jgi:hypothetical protein
VIGKKGELREGGEVSNESACKTTALFEEIGTLEALCELSAKWWLPGQCDRRSSRSWCLRLALGPVPCLALDKAGVSASGVATSNSRENRAEAFLSTYGEHH